MPFLSPCSIGFPPISEAPSDANAGARYDGITGAPCAASGTELRYCLRYRFLPEGRMGRAAMWVEDNGICPIDAPLAADSRARHAQDHRQSPRESGTAPLSRQSRRTHRAAQPDEAHELTRFLGNAGQNLGTQADDELFVRTLINLAKSFGITTVGMGGRREDREAARERASPKCRAISSARRSSPTRPPCGHGERGRSVLAGKPGGKRGEEEIVDAFLL